MRVFGKVCVCVGGGGGGGQDEEVIIRFFFFFLNKNKVSGLERSGNEKECRSMAEKVRTQIIPICL